MEGHAPKNGFRVTPQKNGSPKTQAEKKWVCHLEWGNGIDPDFEDPENHKENNSHSDSWVKIPRRQLFKISETYFQDFDQKSFKYCGVRVEFPGPKKTRPKKVAINFHKTSQIDRSRRELFKNHLVDPHRGLEIAHPTHPQDPVDPLGHPLFSPLLGDPKKKWVTQNAGRKQVGMTYHS